MSRLETAIDTFSEALQRLEGAIESRNPGAVPATALPPDAQDELERLRAERGRFEEEIAALKAENERLANLAGEATRQLDGAIEDMRTVLKQAS
jgi:chromosome segregation ATPase